MDTVGIFQNIIGWFQGITSEFGILYTGVFRAFGGWISETVFGDFGGLLYFLTIGGLIAFLSVAIIRWVI